ncbi:hypothetical protein V502_04550 [Pseudogymnoascus sp. VKM F-4520 (FW-2644)]|nr:hypothetical protein V502_04550 [Pseudogymnoascus sp. VKM F-4520 (FW-2644)]
MAENQVAKPIRAPGIIERYYIARSHLGYYNNVCVTATYSIPPALLSSTLLAADCSTAAANLTYQILAQLISQHPSLGISVLGAGTQTPSWNRLESIDLPSLVTFAEPDVSVEEYLIKLFNTPILGDDGTAPLWRVLVIPSPPDAANGTPEGPAPFRLTIGFFYHHAIGDGLSGAAVQIGIQRALIAALREPSSTPPTTVQPSSADLPPSFETAVPLSITAGGFMRALYETVFPNRDVWSGALITHSKPVVTKMRQFSLSAAQAAALAARCKRHETSVTALLMVVIAEVVAGKTKGAKGIDGNAAISLRKFADGVGPEDMGTYISAMSCLFFRSSAKGKGKLGGGVEWEEAKRVKGLLAKGAGGTKNQFSAFLKLIPNVVKFLEGKPGQSRGKSFEVSNLGVVDFGRGEVEGAEESVGCERVVFGQSANVMGAAYSFSVATVKGGELNVLLSWQKGVVEERIANAVMVELERWLTTEASKHGATNGV